MVIVENSYRYKVFGVNIISEIYMPELLTSDNEVDVRIVFDKVPSGIQFALEYTNQYQLSKSEFLLDIKDVAKYYTKNGDYIIIEPYVNANKEVIKVYLLGTVMGVLLVQRSKIAIHGSTIVIDGQSVVFTGECGAGKTTLCSAFRKKNYGTLSDDISAIGLNDNEVFVVQPAFPFQRLCRDAAIKLGYDINSLPRACSEDEKYLIDINDCFINEDVPLIALVEIRQSECEQVALKEVIGIEKIMVLKRNIYCGLFYRNIGFDKNYFNRCLELAKGISVYCLERPAGRFTVDEQMRLLIEKISNKTRG